MDIYPTNTIAKYITRLPKALEFDSEWEVGISEIIYPRTWYNVLAGQCYGRVTNAEHKVTSRLRVPEGYYETVAEMLGAIAIKTFPMAHTNLVELQIDYDDDAEDTVSFVADALDKDDNNTMVYRYVDGVEFGVVRRTQKVFIRLPQNVHLEISKTLAQVLGFENRKFASGNEYVSTFAADINRSFATMFVYCDVVRESIVGNTTVPLLRTLNVEGRYGDIIQKTYHAPIYVPLQRSYFDSIEINIRDDTGRLVPFESGKAIVTLHFRRSRNPYFLPIANRRRIE